MAILSVDQLRFVAAMQCSATKKEAAELIGIEPNTTYKWPKIVDEAVLLAAQEREMAAREVFKNHLMKAAMVKVKGLDSDDDSLRQKVATEIIEWNLGKATQKSELTGANGGPVEVHDVTELTAEQRRAQANVLAHAARERLSALKQGGETNND